MFRILPLVILAWAAIDLWMPLAAWAEEPSLTLDLVLELTEQEMAPSARSIANACTRFLKTTPPPSRSVRLALLNKRATAYLHLGQDKESLADYEVILNVEKENLVARWGKARALYGLGRLDDALVETQRLIDEHPNNPKYLSTAAKVYCEKKNYKRCIELADQAIAADLRFPEGYYARFTANFEMKRNEAALRDLNHFLERRPFVPISTGSTNLYAVRGMLLSSMGATYYPDAISSFQMAKALEPSSYEASMGLSTIYHQTGRHRLGKQWAEDGTRVAPSRPGTWVFLGHSCMLLGQYDDAVRGAEKALSIDPKGGAAHALLAKVYFLQDKYELSYDAGNRCLGADPSNWEVHYRQALILSSAPEAKLRDGKKALRYAKRSCELAGDSEMRCWLALGAAHAECGEFDRAVAAIEKGRSLKIADATKTTDRMAELLLETFRQNRPFRIPNGKGVP